MFDKYDKLTKAAFRIYLFGVVLHGCIMLCCSVVGSDEDTLMTVAQDANAVAQYTYLIPAICYVIAALICLFADGWKAMVMMTILIVAAHPVLILIIQILSFIIQAGIWLFLAVIVAMIAIVVLGVFFPVTGIVFYYCAPELLVALFIILIMGFFGFFATSVGF